MRALAIGLLIAATAPAAAARHAAHASTFGSHGMVRLAGRGQFRFRPEMTLDVARAIIAGEGDALPAGRHLPAPAAMFAAPGHFGGLRALLWPVLDALS